MNYEVPTVRVSLKEAPEQEMVINATDFDPELHVRVRVRVPTDAVVTTTEEAPKPTKKSSKKSSKKTADE